MWVSSSNASLPPRCFTGSTPVPHLFTCGSNDISLASFTVFTATNVLALPLYFRTLWTGFRRPRASTSHSDVIVGWMAVMEAVGVLGLAWYCGAMHLCGVEQMKVGYYSIAMTFPGQTFFHCLTCMDRYLAVVHPVTYMSLRGEGGLRARNACIGSVWLLSLAYTGYTAVVFPDFPVIMMYVLLNASLAVASFCSAATVRELIRLGLGRVGGRRLDPAKLKAFNTIMAILGVLVLRFSGLLVCNFLFQLETAAGESGCTVMVVGFWLCLPSSLVLPALFLHRARR